jgi:oligopeptidase B
MAPVRALKEELYREIIGHIRETDVSVPFLENGWLYYSRTEERRQYPILCRRSAPDAPEEVTLDVNALSEGKEFMAIGDHAVSDDGRLLAYSTDDTGERQFALRPGPRHWSDRRRAHRERPPIPRCGPPTAERSTTSGRTTPSVRAACTGGSRGRFEALVYEETDERFDVEGVQVAQRKYVFLSASGARRRKSGSPGRRPGHALPPDRRAQPKITNARRRPSGRSLLHSEQRSRGNGTGASISRVLTARPPSRRENWRELVPSAPTP